jgi:type I site-specific restriction endonuclease
MATKILTKDTTEAELEAKVRAAVCKALPWVPESALTHQVRFSFAIGRAKIDVDGSTTTEERTDILVQLHGKPLAVFELKRPGLELTADDEAQGLSYAKVMDPPYPLVIITNGDDTRIRRRTRESPGSPKRDRSRNSRN